METSRPWCHVGAALMAMTLTVSLAYGQEGGPKGGPPGGPKGPPPGKGPGNGPPGKGPPGKGPPSYLRQLDVDRDGLLTVEELPERVRPALEQAVQAAGGNLRQGLEVQAVEQAVAATVGQRPLPGDAKSRQLGDELMGQFDADRDGKLTKEEWKGLEETTGWKGGGGHRKADFDFDEQVRPAELTLWITLQDPINRGGDPKGPKPPPQDASTGPASQSRSADPGQSTFPPASPWEGRRSYRSLSPMERLPAGLPDWFRQKDGNQDGQVMMSEFASQFTDVLAADYFQYDLNRDGVITSAECLKSLARSDGTGRTISGARSALRPSSVPAAAPPNAPRPDAGVLAQRYDSNGDGTLDKDEWKSMERAENLKGGGGHKKADQNRDDRIDPAELEVWLASRPPK